MTERRYDLETRTYAYAKNVALFCKELPKTIPNTEYYKQLIRSSSSVGANYIEANESLGKKDFLLRLRICRKEAKESTYWLELLLATNDEHHEHQGKKLILEGTELKKIFSSIIEKIQRTI